MLNDCSDIYTMGVYCTRVQITVIPNSLYSLDLSSSQTWQKYIRFACGFCLGLTINVLVIIYDDEIQLMFRLIKCFLVFRITQIVSLLSQLCILSNTSTARNIIYKYNIVNDNGDILY